MAEPRKAQQSLIPEYVKIEGTMEKVLDNFEDLVKLRERIKRAAILSSTS